MFYIKSTFFSTQETPSNHMNLHSNYMSCLQNTFRFSHLSNPANHAYVFHAHGYQRDPSAIASEVQDEYAEQENFAQGMGSGMGRSDERDGVLLRETEMVGGPCSRCEQCVCEQ